MEMKENKLYETSDFYLACFLLSKDCDLSSVEPSVEDNKKKNFIFAIKKDKNNLINSFYNGKGLISAKKYVHCIRDLKGILYKN